MKKKLYFDFQFTGSQRACLFPCTWHATTVSVPPDKTVIERHRELLDPLPALTGGAPAAIQERREVSAWFYLVTAITSSLDQFCMDFVGRNLTTPLPFLTPGNVVVTSKVGQSTCFTQHFAVRLRLLQSIVNSGVLVTAHTPTINQFYRNHLNYRGICYVQRQHSVEV